MSMSKQDFIALADAIKEHQTCSARNSSYTRFTTDQLDVLATVCKRQNSAFNRERWIGYIDGENGPNGGTVR